MRESDESALSGRALEQMPSPLKRWDRSRVDNTRPSFHLFESSLSQEENRKQIRAENGFELLKIDCFDFSASPRILSVVHQDIDSSEVFHNLRDQFLATYGLAQITFISTTNLALSLDEVASLLHAPAIRVVDNREFRSFACEVESDRAAHCGLAPGD